jgi:hypothetical protein
MHVQTPLILKILFRLNPEMMDGGRTREINNVALLDGLGRGLMLGDDLKIYVEELLLF